MMKNTKCYWCDKNPFKGCRQLLWTKRTKHPWNNKYRGKVPKVRCQVFEQTCTKASQG